MKQMIMSVGTMLATLLMVLSTLALGIDRQYEVRLYNRVSSIVSMTEEVYSSTGFDIERIVDLVTKDILEADIQYKIIEANTTDGTLEIEMEISYWYYGIYKSAKETRRIITEKEV